MNIINDMLVKAWCGVVSFAEDKKGASGIEYAVIATIAAVTIATFATGNDTIADRIEQIFTNVKDSMPTKATP